jgi:hypothetical protein
MKLVRLVIVSFEPYPEDREGWRFEAGSVTVEAFVAWKNGRKTTVAVSATIALQTAPEITEDGLIIVPEEPRRETEEAIESVVALIAISAGSRRRIASLSPHVAFVPSDGDSASALSAASGITVDPISIPSMEADISITTLNQLQDRIDGVLLLAEALASTHASGRYHELIRFFERAFRSNYKQLPQHLTHFLSRSDLGYTAAEVRKWIDELRDPLAHGGRDTLVLESDVSLLINRIEQAAYDVLFNKVDWRTPSAKRRDLWTPASGTASEDPSEIFVTKGRAAVLTGTLYDPFGAYPIDLHHSLPEAAIPAEWWMPSIREITYPGTLHVLPGPEELSPSDDKATDD